MPYIHDQILKWVYAKLQIYDSLMGNGTENYNNREVYRSFLDRLNLNVLAVRTYLENIQVEVHLKVDNLDWKQTLDNTSGNDILNIRLDKGGTE